MGATITGRGRELLMARNFGHVAERTREGADEHIDALAKKHLGADTYPYCRPGEQRVIIRVEPEQIFIDGG